LAPASKLVRQQFASGRVLMQAETQSGPAIRDKLYDAVVIGAGFAGLAAARHLHKAGLSVVVLEALDRVGGRAKTIQTSGGQLEMGAQWFHGTEGHPVYEYAVAKGLIDRSFSENEFEDMEMQTLTPSGKLEPSFVYSEMESFQGLWEDMAARCSDAGAVLTGAVPPAPTAPRIAIDARRPAPSARRRQRRHRRHRPRVPRPEPRGCAGSAAGARRGGGAARALRLLVQPAGPDRRRPPTRHLPDAGLPPPSLRSAPDRTLPTTLPAAGDGGGRGRGRGRGKSSAADMAGC
jgi:hypothetical protein